VVDGIKIIVKREISFCVFFTFLWTVMSVCVIGAGPSGLIAAKELLNVGCRVTVYEKSGSIGGLFSSSYNNLLLTSSSSITAFSTHRGDVDSNPRFWTAGEYVNYLTDFAVRYGVLQLVLLNHVVQNIYPNDENDLTQGFTVSVRDLKEERHEKFDYVIISTGVNDVKACSPDWVRSCSSKVIHSSEYKNTQSPLDLIGKNVLFVGGGESSSDISLEVSMVAKNVRMSLRTTTGLIIPRYFSQSMKIPSDHDTSRIHHSSPRRLWYLKNWFYRCMYRMFGSLIFDKQIFFSIITQMNEGLFESGLDPFNTYGTKSESICKAIEKGMVLTPEVDYAEGKKIFFKNGEVFNADVVILCTGFKVCLPFLRKGFPSFCSAAESNVRNLFKNMIHPEFGERITFIGFVRPCFGSIPPMSEMQARYIAQLISGNLQLPSKKELKEVIDADKILYDQIYPRDRSKTMLRDFVLYLEEMAAMLHCQPNFYRLFFDSPLTAFKLYCGPLQVAQYRLQGPNSDFSVIDSLKQTKLHSFIIIFAHVLILLVGYFMFLISFAFPSYRQKLRRLTVSADPNLNFHGILPSSINLKETLVYMGTPTCIEFTPMRNVFKNLSSQFPSNHVMKICK